MSRLTFQRSFAGGKPAGAGAYCRQSRDRLKPGLRIQRMSRLTFQRSFAGGMPAGAGAYCRQSRDRLKPGLRTQRMSRLTFQRSFAGGKPTGAGYGVRQHGASHAPYGCLLLRATDYYYGLQTTAYSPTATAGCRSRRRWARPGCPVPTRRRVPGAHQYRPGRVRPPARQYHPRAGPPWAAPTSAWPWP